MYITCPKWSHYSLTNPSRYDCRALHRLSTPKKTFQLVNNSWRRLSRNSHINKCKSCPSELSTILTLRRTRSEYYIDSGGSLHEESRRLIAGDGSTTHNIMGTCSSEKPGIFKSTRPVCVLNTMLFALWI